MPFFRRGSFGSRPHLLHITLISISFEPTRNFEFWAGCFGGSGSAYVLKEKTVGSGVILIYNIAFNGIPAGCRVVMT